jgi:uncharacterized membrane protein
MKLTDFEAHILWARLDAIENVLAVVRREDTGENIDTIDELDTRAAQLRALYKSRRRLAPLVVPTQLEGVDGHATNWSNSVNSAHANSGANRSQYLQQAVQHAQYATASASGWPHANPTAAEERLEVAVVDALLAREEEVDERIRGRVEAATRELRQIDQKTVELTRAVDKTEARIEKLVDDATAAVNAEKARIATVIDEGNARIAGFDAALEKHLREWQARRSATFEKDLGDMRHEQEELLQQAKASFTELTRVVADYESLVQADSADRLAVHYEAEAKNARRGGKRMNTFGFILLISAAVPLFLVVLQPLLKAFGLSLDAPSWESIVARVGVALVLAGAATVAIRLGTADLRRAADYKRLAMELRTMGPFLSAVEDTDSVGQARLDLVNRTFGQSYAPSRDEKFDDAVPVSVLQQLLTLLTRTVSK